MIDLLIERLTDPKSWLKESTRRVNEDGSVSRCIGGWINYIADGSRVNDELYWKVGEAAKELYPAQIDTHVGFRVTMVVAFNDHKDTTHEHVLKVLERVKELEAKK